MLSFVQHFPVISLKRLLRDQCRSGRYLITADGFYRGGKQINLKEEADQAVADSSSIEKVFVVRRTNEEVSWNADKDVDWEQLKTLDTHFESVHTNGDDPYMIIFTSGTTVNQKGHCIHIMDFQLKQRLMRVS